MELPKVTGKKMFGCHALWADGNVFALIWKTGRIGVKLTESADYDTLLSIKGSAPWKAGPKVMSHWVLVPEEFHKGVKLGHWVKKAHAQALGAAPKPKKKKNHAASGRS
ncbi:MAG: TfoX/Sxy family protein [Bdellovibrionota bacterium]